VRQLERGQAYDDQHDVEIAAEARGIVEDPDAERNVPVAPIPVHTA